MVQVMTKTYNYTDFQNSLCELKSVLLDSDHTCLERLAGLGLGSLLGVPVRFARAGYQRGGDGGMSGVRGRNLVFEARCYGPRSRLNEREILGQITQAVDRNPELEAWILVTTKEVPEQTQDAMERAGLKLGVATIIIDWLPQPLPKLAVLAASCPACFAVEVASGHDPILKRIASSPDYTVTLEAIKAELESWSIGYQTVRHATHARVREIWQSRRKANARFGQDVAGGEKDAHYVRRINLTHCLDSWSEVASNGVVGALVGLDGAGKTWAAIDWLQLRLNRLPIVVLAPSSALGNITATRADLIRFIARYLHDTTEVRTEAYWEQKVRRLFARPRAAGPTLILLFDGLNQCSSFDWLAILRLLQDDPFYQRTLILISCRTSFFDEQLNGLNLLLESPHRIDIGNYEQTPGGTLDQKLALAGLTRDDLPAHLVDHAVVPRLFDLIVRLRNKLGDVREVTVHRLLWEYGASTIFTSTERAFTATQWRRFVSSLAEDYRDGSRHSTIDSVTTLSTSAILTPDAVYRRISGVIDGIFAELNKDGDLLFHADFVYHALGLALLARLEHAGPDEEAINILEQFLDPISGYQGRAETLRATVAVALHSKAPGRAKWLGSICKLWLHSQNLPESHVEDLVVLAKQLVTPLLDVIEASRGHSHSTPRHIAVNAISTVDGNNLQVAADITKRGVDWHRFISLEKHRNHSKGVENSFHARRCERLSKRIGVAQPGPVTIAGQVFEIIDQSDEDLIVVAAQLLQGRPLKNAIHFFEMGAIYTAIVGAHAAQESQSWLNVVNTVDPEETAAGLRRAAEMIRLRRLEPGVHPDLSNRISSLLLWRTGYAVDAETASKTNPKIDHGLSYETDYLPDPARSLFRLERRHAAQVLCDTSVDIFRRIERARDALLDPSFQIPATFIDNLIVVADSLDFNRTATDRSRSVDDLWWEHLSLALARCMPERLAERERSRLRQFAERPLEQRFGSALAAPDLMLLVGKDEAAALQTLRNLGNTGQDRNEHTIQSNLLIAEIQSETATAQITKIINANLGVVDVHLGRACHTPSKKELDELVNIYCGDTRQLCRLASILAEHDLRLSDHAFEKFVELLYRSETDINPEAAWVLLASNKPAHLGAVLDASNWAWSCDRSFVENIMGSIAIAASNRGSKFSELASRIAPAKLLKTLSQEKRSRKEVKLAVEILSAVLCELRIDPREPGLEISYYQQAADVANYEFTVGKIVEEYKNEDGIRRLLEKVNHPERHAQRRFDLIQSYIREIDEARRSGAQLYLAYIDAEHFGPVLEQYPEAVDLWLGGMESLSVDFKNRVRLAEGFFMALCEALMKRDPPRGLSLWRHLRMCLTTRFIGRNNIDRLLHALFSSLACTEVNIALEEIYCLNESRSDDDLMNLVTIARSSGRVEWLRDMVCRDLQSSSPVHQQRATFLKPLLTLPEIAGDAQWPTGTATSAFEEIGQNGWIIGQRESFAAHWLKKFAEAETAEEAHASWRLFKACSDRRAWIWMDSIFKSHASRNEPLEAAKRRFIEQERDLLVAAMADNEKWWSDNFAGRRFTKTLLPWRSNN